MVKYTLKIVFLIFVLSICGRAEEQIKTEAKIGVILPLTGEFGHWGQAIKNGLLLAAENTARRYLLDFQDEGNCDAKAAVGAMQKFINVEHIKIVFMGCLAGTKAAAPLALQNKVLMLSTGLLDEEVYERKIPIINLATQLSTESKFLAAHIANRQIKKVALLRWPDAFGEELARSLKQELLKRNISVVIDEPSITSGADFKSLFPRLKRAGADAVVTNLGEAQIQILMKQLKEQGLSIPVLSNYVIEVNNQPNRILDGIEYTYPVNAAESSEAKKKLDDDFLMRFGEAPAANSYFAYDGLIAVDRALNSCRAEDTTCLFSYIVKNLHSGLSGEVKFEANGSNIRPYGVKRVSGGNFVWVEKDLKLQ